MSSPANISFANYFHQLNSGLCLLIGWPANLLLIWLILCRTQQQAMRVWSRILLQTAFVDLIASLTFFLVHPVPMADGLTVFYVLEGPFARAPQPLTLGLYYFYSFWQEFAKYSLAVQFIFRWLLICRDKELSTRSYVLLLLIPAGMAFFIVFIIHWGLAMDGSMGLPASTASNCAAATSASCSLDQTVVFSIRQNSVFLLLVTVTLMATNLATYSIILLSILSIWMKSRQALMLEQPQSREISRQIGLVLIIQASIPLTLYLVPTGLTLIYNTIGLARPQWLSMAFVQCWPSVVYPMASLLILKQYRRILRKLFCPTIGLTQTVVSLKMLHTKMRQVQTNPQMGTTT